MIQNKPTDELTAVLNRTAPGGLEDYLRDNAPELAEGDRPFAAYVRALFREKGMRQQQVFLRADISEGYGYKLVGEEKHTHRRDVILRLCLGGRFTLTETQRALKLYGMAPLYAKVPRDAALIVALNTRMWEPEQVNDLLAQHGFAPLEPCSPD